MTSGPDDPPHWGPPSEQSPPGGPDAPASWWAPSPIDRSFWPIFALLATLTALGLLWILLAWASGSWR